MRVRKRLDVEKIRNVESNPGFSSAFLSVILRMHLIV